MLKNPTPENSQKYKSYKNILNSVLRNAKRAYYANTFNKYEKDSKKTWETISELLGKENKNDDAPKQIRQLSGELTTDQQKQANTLNEYFTQVDTPKRHLSVSLSVCS